MPAYDYDCDACGERFEVLHGVHADRPTTCPVCGGGPIRKAISAPTIHYKGSGWAKKERRATASPSTSKPPSETSASGDTSVKAGDEGRDPASSPVVKTPEAGPPATSDRPT
jgi:putative FmdB family regulatory protein